MKGHYKVLAAVGIDQRLVTGKTKHLVEGRLAEIPCSLQIAQIDDDPGYYLIYLDQLGHELTDTYHETFKGAMEQATFEFQVSSAEWKLLGNDS